MPNRIQQNMAARQLRDRQESSRARLDLAFKQSNERRRIGGSSSPSNFNGRLVYTEGDLTVSDMICDTCVFFGSTLTGSALLTCFIVYLATPKSRRMEAFKECSAAFKIFHRVAAVFYVVIILCKAEKIIDFIQPLWQRAVKPFHPKGEAQVSTSDMICEASAIFGGSLTIGALLARHIVYLVESKPTKASKEVSAHAFKMMHRASAIFYVISILCKAGTMINFTQSLQQRVVKPLHPKGKALTVRRT